MLENRAFLYGEGLFVTMRIHDSRLLAKNRHFRRLKGQIEAYYLKRKLTFSEDEFLFEKFNFIESEITVEQDEVVRLSVFADFNVHLINREISLDKLHFHIQKREVVPRSKLSLKTFQNPYRSEHFPNLKMPSYMPLFALRTEAIAENFDDILLLENDCIVEASTSNILLCQGNQLYMPKHCNYYGSSAEIICEIFDVKKQKISKEELTGFDCAFLLNAANIVMDIIQIDEHKFESNSDLKNKLLEGYLQKANE